MAIEKRIILAAAVFVFALTGLIAMSVRAFGIGVPTCLNDVRPFREAKVIQQAPNRYEVHYVAKMWAFEPAEVAVKPGSTVDFYVATADVTHGMQIIGTNVNLMAVPGAVNYARVKFDKAGEYLVVCNEYCGLKHHNMAGRVIVSDAAAQAPPPSLTAVAQMFDQYGCTSCHSIDGSEMSAPTFKGMYGSKRQLADGTFVVADEAYLRESITKPEAKVVKGFDAMPELPVDAGDVQKLIELIETLK